jgi:hypothetical protein
LPKCARAPTVSKVNEALTVGALSEVGVFAFCAAMGFVTSATIATFYQWVTSERAELFANRGSVAGLMLAVALGMFAGPFIVVQKVWGGLRSRELKALPAVVGVVIAGMWSVCAGIFYVSLLVSA